MPLAFPGMIEQGWCRVIGVAMLPPCDSPAYAYNVAKASRACALHLARDEAWRGGVTVNIVSPGPVPKIEGLKQAIDQCDHGLEWRSRKTTSPQDIAEGVAFLCSEVGRFVLGCELPYLFNGL
jgi:NAD(P)-dependent dehydrogenase (short-subunit alcohol dehydrogenase family)